MEKKSAENFPSAEFVRAGYEIMELGINKEIL